MIKSILTFILVVFAFVATSQNRTYYNFHFTKLLNQIEKGEIDAKEPIGIMVKGDISKIETFLLSHEGSYRSSVKGWHYIQVPAEHLSNLSEKEFVIQFNYKSYKGQPMNDTMRVNNKVNDVHLGLPPLHTPFTGQGVLMGVIDTGIEWKHPDFQFSNGDTRILYIWDQTQAVNSYTPSEYGYGQEWDSSLLNINFPNHDDQWGHGSTVAGAACGNGLANGTHKGVAPNTLIVAVESNFNAPNWLGTVIDAMEYIYHVADSLDMPCVINASIGDYTGSHDGLDPYALYIDSLITSKQGRLLVAAAGNSGDWDPYHLHGNVTSDTTFTWFDVNPSSIIGNAVFYEIWADTANFNNVNFAIGADDISNGHYFAGRTNFRTIQSNLNTLYYDTLRNNNGDQITTIQTWAEYRDGQYLLQVYLPTPDSSSYKFRFETYGNGSFDCWSTSTLGTSNIDFQNYINLPLSLQPFYILPDSLQSIVSSFQCSPNVITVANYNNDSGYVNKYNNWIDMGTPKGELSTTSSKGPTRTGLLKPDLAASGATTNSSFPLNLLDYLNNNAPLDTNIAFGGMHYRNGGTSMSSPVVAGVGALLLEKCPNLTPQAFKEALINSTYADNFTGSLPNYAFGYGKLDAFSTLVYTNYQPSLTGNTSFCFGDSTLISAINYDSILWEDGSTNLSRYIDSSVSLNYFVIDSLGCKSDTALLTTTEFPQLQSPVININLDTISTTGNYSFQWYLDNNILTGETNNYTIAVQNGYYSVEVTDTNNCSITSDSILFNTVNISTIEGNDFIVFPNPTNGVIYTLSELPHKIIITNNLGAIIYSSSNNVTQHFVDLSKQSKGIYFLTIVTDKDTIVQKFIKN